MLKAKDAVCLQLRRIKDKDEIMRISYACEISDSAFRYIQPFIIPGVSEIALADRIDNFFKRNGVSNAFTSIVAFGQNSAVPHHMPTLKKLAVTDNYVLFDIGAKFKNYCGDLSRTVFVGQLSDEIRNQYHAVLAAQENALKVLNK